MIGVDFEILSISLAGSYCSPETAGSSVGQEKPETTPTATEDAIAIQAAALHPMEGNVDMTAHFELNGIATASRQFNTDSLRPLANDANSNDSADASMTSVGAATRVGVLVLMQPTGQIATKDWSLKPYNLSVSLTLHNHCERPLLLRGDAQLQLQLRSDEWMPPETSRIMCKRSWSSQIQVNLFHAQGVSTLGAVAAISVAIREIDIRPLPLPSSLQRSSVPIERPANAQKLENIAYGGLEEMKRLALERRNPFLDGNQNEALSDRSNCNSDEEGDDVCSSLESFSSILKRNKGAEGVAIGSSLEDVRHSRSLALPSRSDRVLNSPAKAVYVMRPDRSARHAPEQEIKAAVSSIDTTEIGAFVTYFIERDVSNGLERSLKYEPHANDVHSNRQAPSEAHRQEKKNERSAPRAGSAPTKPPSAAPRINMRPNTSGAKDIQSKKPVKNKRVSEVSQMLFFSPMKRREDALRTAKKEKKREGNAEKPQQDFISLTPRGNKSPRRPRTPRGGAADDRANLASPQPPGRAPRLSHVTRSADAREASVLMAGGGERATAPSWWPLSTDARDTSGIVLQL